MVCAASVDERNCLAARIEQRDTAEIGKLNAALQQKNGFENIGQVIDFTYNVDFYVHIPEVHTYRDLGDYYLNQSGMVQMPEEWQGGIDLAAFGRNAAEHGKGAFTEYGYSVESGEGGERLCGVLTKSGCDGEGGEGGELNLGGGEGREKYRIWSTPKKERGKQKKV